MPARFLDREALLLSARTAVAAVVSLLLARGLLRLPEFYWAPISTIVILLSTIDPLSLAWQRFVGTALGAALGALIATFFTSNWIVYGLGIFVCGILCKLLRLGNAYRFAGIALTIVLLIPHTAPPWTVALHRFIEVSLGIAVALVVTLLWKLPSEKSAGSAWEWPNRVASGAVRDGRADVNAAAPQAGTEGANANQNQNLQDLGQAASKIQHQALTTREPTNVSSPEL